MRHNEEDKKLAQALKQAAHDPGENEWFTRRVLNKLPERKRPGTAWASVVMYAIALLACGAAWLMMLHGQDFKAVTVRDVLHNVLMGCVTLVVLWQEVVSLMRLAD